MSEWHEAKKEDIQVEPSSSEVNIYVTFNDFGNVYLTLTFDQIKEIHAEVARIEAKP